VRQAHHLPGAGRVAGMTRARLAWMLWPDNVDPHECPHAQIMPEFDAEAAKGLSAAEVKRRWPRYEGVCPDCGQGGAFYASYEHYLMGDW